MLEFMVPQCVYVSAAFNLWNEIQYEIVEDKPRRQIYTHGFCLATVARPASQLKSSSLNRQFIHSMHSKDTFSKRVCLAISREFLVSFFLLLQLPNVRFCTQIKTHWVEISCTLSIHHLSYTRKLSATPLSRLYFVVDYCVESIRGHSLHE